MFNLEETITRWRKEMISAGVTRAEYLDELELHLRQDFELSTRCGESPEAAFEAAVKRLGDKEALAAEFQKSATAERRQVITRAILIGAGVFLLGTLSCYFILLPLVTSADAAYSKWLGFSQIQFQHSTYLRFATRLVIGLSLAFEIPVLISTLVALGILDHHLLAKRRKYALILNLVIGALTSGPGVAPQLFMFLLLQGLYELSLWLVRTQASRDNTLQPHS